MRSHSGEILQLAVAPLQLHREGLEFFRRSLALADVMDESVEGVGFSHAQGRDRHFHRELMAVAMQGGKLDALVKYRSLAGGQEMPQAAVMRLAVSRRNNGLGQVSAE